MASDIHTGHEPSMTGLVTGIVHDAQQLLGQQLSLFREEIKEDLRKTKDAALALSIGIGIVAVGGLLWCLMLVHLLFWLAPVLPLWACYGIIGLVLVACGGGLLYVGKRRLQSFNPLPEQSVRALKENVQWLMNPRK